MSTFKNFPLYNNILSKIQETDVTKTDLTISQKEFISKIKLDQKGNENMYLLIKCYYIDHEKSKYDIPYSGKHIKSKNGIKFDIDILPIPLKQMIYRFIKLHSQTMNEDNENERIRTTPH